MQWLRLRPVCPQLQRRSCRAPSPRMRPGRHFLILSAAVAPLPLLAVQEEGPSAADQAKELAAGLAASLNSAKPGEAEQAALTGAIARFTANSGLVAAAGGVLVAAAALLPGPREAIISR